MGKLKAMNLKLKDKENKRLLNGFIVFSYFVDIMPFTALYNEHAYALYNHV